MAERSLPPLNWLRAFEASARHLSFTGAALELHMTQSAISQQIKSLESYLGKPLFLRRTRRLELTDVAMNYLPTVQYAFATLRSGTRNLIGFDREQVLEIQSNLAFSVFWLAPRLPRLFAKHPWIKMNLTTALWSPEGASPTADIEFRFGREGVATSAAERLSSDHYFPVCAPEQEADKIDDIFDAPLFDCGGLHANWDAWLRAQDRSLPDGKAVNWASTFVVSFSAVMSGQGFALAHDTLANGLLSEGKLKRPFDASVAMEEAYYLLRPDRVSSSPAVSAFLDWFEEEHSAFLRTRKHD